ncbi:hypothetical protein H0A61_00225 [Koleobacter methoxysyntrophicus]|uniref:HEPN domain-containing protein n=1 Tax=Koleobacter methoxysyntrophicus TaxID=2751313 RepID=A0A8A0RJU6_9FIRM|nr:hypothetical protein [Koleobacter methoxysyntrophicus]QSQ07908.1 hypothetical protein H0A61_00225 [Koleobacter methoxysyntrophicus]
MTKIHEIKGLHPDRAPFEHYGSLQSEEAVKYACEILEFVRTQMA